MFPGNRSHCLPSWLLFFSKPLERVKVLYVLKVFLSANPRAWTPIPEEKARRG